MKLLKLLRKNYLDEIKIVYIDIASVKTLYIRLTLLRAQMSIFPIGVQCNEEANDEIITLHRNNFMMCDSLVCWKASGACPQQKIG